MCVCVWTLRKFVSPITHEPHIGSVFRRLHFFPAPRKEHFRRLVNTRCVFRSFNIDFSSFSQILNAISFQNQIFRQISISNFISWLVAQWELQLRQFSRWSGICMKSYIRLSELFWIILCWFGHIFSIFRKWLLSPVI